jgi:peptide/nickel transport system substrate-binding protein
VRNHKRTAWGAALIVASAVALSACGSSSSSSSSSSSGGSSSGKSGTVTVLFGTAPDSLDPQFSYVTQSAEPDWIVYTGLTTYKHATGTPGGQLIPGLATALPAVSKDGKTYTATLRKGLVFSNGQPVKASDFAYSVERAIKMPWGGSGQFLTNQIVGATAFSKGSAKTISGITTDDKTGKITIHLLAPYGAFGNVLAFPALGVVPSGSPFKNEPNNPPPGVGPYVIKNIVPNVSYSLVRNPQWAKMNIPGIPAGHVDINAKVSTNVESNALSVLNNSADVFDWADVLPGSLISQIQSKASDRYSKVVMNSTYYFFMNTQTKPFSSQLARQAVVTGLDEDALNRLSSGTLLPACYYLPPGMTGHPSAPCPYGNPPTPNLAKAKALVKQSGMAGTPVTVWGQMRSPRRQWVDYYTSYLNQIGFKATEKIIADATYFATIGNVKLNAQTGFADWNQDFPNPIDFYFTIEGSGIVPTNNENFGLIKDSQIDGQSKALGAVPTTKLSSIASKWQALDEYTAKKAYLAVFGYQTFPKFTSNRLNFGSIVFSPLYGYDWTSFQLK